MKARYSTYEIYFSGLHIVQHSVAMNFIHSCTIDNSIFIVKLDARLNN